MTWKEDAEQSDLSQMLALRPLPSTLQMGQAHHGWYRALCTLPTIIHEVFEYSRHRRHTAAVIPAASFSWSIWCNEFEVWRYGLMAGLSCDCWPVDASWRWMALQDGCCDDVRSGNATNLKSDVD